MKWLRYTSRQESYANTLLWTVMLIVPLVGMVILSSVDNNYEYRWIDVWHILRPMCVVLLGFLIHNYFIAPQLIYHHNRLKYGIMLIALLVVFVLYQCNSGPPARPGWGQPQPAKVEANPGTQPPPRPKPLAGPHDFTMFSLLVFALGANLGIKLYFKTQLDMQHMAELEKENLRQELSYLRYQVNPHFLMNTLNNIHALVDIDPAEAKSCIVHLSRFMRYLLYESEQELISLQQAIDLITQYLDLMCKRYTDQVDIHFDAPQQVPNVGLAPLLLIPFIENAFKHGISYDKPTFIHITLIAEGDNIKFSCVNSKNNAKHEVGGVGLTNVVKRLDLIYGNRYTLNIDDNVNYSVQLTVPAEKMSLGPAKVNSFQNSIH